MEREPVPSPSNAKLNVLRQFAKEFWQLPPGPSFMPVCPGPGVLGRVVRPVKHKVSYINLSRTKALRMANLEHSWECFPAHQGWLNRFPALTAHSDSHTVCCPLSCHTDACASCDHRSSLSYTYKYILQYVFFNSGPFQGPSSSSGHKTIVLITLLGELQGG